MNVLRIAAERMEKWYNIKITIDNSRLRENKLYRNFVNVKPLRGTERTSFLVRFGTHSEQ